MRRFTISLVAGLTLSGLLAGCGMSRLPMSPMPVSTMPVSTMTQTAPQAKAQSADPHAAAAKVVASALAKRFKQPLNLFLGANDTITPTAKAGVFAFDLNVDLAEDGADILLVTGTVDMRTGTVVVTHSEHTSA